MRKRNVQRQQGYSLVELLIGFTVAIIVLILLFQTFEKNTQLARTQIDVADMQQSQRAVQNEISRLVRMTGRGGLAHMIDRGDGTRYLPALNVRDNVAAGQNIAVGDANTPEVVEGSDVLTIRGVFNSPVYQLNFANPGTLQLFDNGGAPTTIVSQAVRGILTVTDPSPTGVPQDLVPLCEAIQNGVPEAVVIVSPIDDGIYGVVEIAGGSCDDPTSPTLAAANFNIIGGSYTAQYRTLYNSGLGGNPVLPSGLTNAAYAGIVEEYRFYARQPDPDTLPAPALSMARMFPGTEVAYGQTAGEQAQNLQLDLADNMLDLQFALGYDSPLGDALADRNGDGFTNENDIVLTETEDGEDDDWLFNGAGDDPNAQPFVPPWDRTGTTAPPQPRIYYVRFTTLARVQVPDRNYDSLQIVRIENRDVDPFNSLDERRFRRQLLQTTIDLRNL